MNSTRTYRALGFFMVFSALCAGLLLIPLLGIGVFLTISSDFFQYTFLAHAFFQFLAVILSALLLSRLIRRSSWSVLAFLPFLLVVLGVIVVNSLPPPVSKDALIHHLAVPKWWVEADRIYQIKWHSWSYYPMLVNLGYTGLLSRGLGFLAPFYHFSFLFILAAAAARFILYKTEDSDLALGGFVLAVSLPVCVRLATSAMVDLGLALYSGLAFCFAVYWIEAEKKRVYNLIFAGVALGLALSTKYNGILITGVFGAAFLVLCSRSKIGVLDSIGSLIIITVTALAVFAPWCLKNAYWTFNPFYPLFNSFFSGDSTAGAGVSLKPLQYRLVRFEENWLDILLMPLKMIFSGADKSVQYFDGVLSPVLIFCILPVYRSLKRPWLAFGYIILFFYFYAAILTSPARVRYMAPLLLPVVVLTITGFQNAASFVRKSRRGWVYAFVFGLHFVFTLYYSYSFTKERGSLAYLWNHQTRDEYLKERFSIYPLIEYANSHLSGTKAVYLVYTGNLFYYFDIPVQGQYDSGKDLVDMVKRFTEPGQVAREFKRRGVGYLLFHDKRTRRYLESPVNGLSSEQKTLWNNFVANYLKQLKQQNGLSLWEIKSGTEPRGKKR